MSTKKDTETEENARRPRAFSFSDVHDDVRSLRIDANRKAGLRDIERPYVQRWPVLLRQGTLRRFSLQWTLPDATSLTCTGFRSGLSPYS